MAKGKRQAWRRNFALCLLPFAFCHAAELGTITGFAKYPGESAPRSMFANVSDPDCPRGIAQTHLLIKQETRGLRNVLVVLERGERRIMPIRLQAQLAAEGCQLLPRLQWVPLGTSLTLVNKDGAEHHLHAYLGDNSVFEVDLPPGARPARRPMVVPGLYKINCDKHLWERAWVYASPDDTVAVSDPKGEFRIKRVPAGRYRIRAWHEGWIDKGKDRDGRLVFQPMQEIQAITVRDNRESQVIFDNLAQFDIKLPPS